MTETNTCGVAGDDGGPFLAGQQAQGIAVDAIGTCSDNEHFAYFVPIVPILPAFRLKVLTNGTPTTPPAVASLHCERTGDGTTFHCLAVPYHPDAVQIRRTVNGAAKSAWNNETLVSGSCPNPNGRVNIQVIVSNSSGSGTRIGLPPLRTPSRLA